MSFEYPSDPNVWSIDKQFLIGNSIMISPALDQSQYIVDAYFPNDLWFNYFTGEQMKQGKKITRNYPTNEIFEFQELPEKKDILSFFSLTRKLTFFL